MVAAVTARHAAEIKDLEQTPEQDHPMNLLASWDLSITKISAKETTVKDEKDKVVELKKQ
jgi:hypothetical protein